MSMQLNRLTKWKLWTIPGFLILMSVVVGMTGLLKARPQPPIGSTVAGKQRFPMEEIDHSPFDKMLKKYVDNDGYVNYQAWKRSSQDRQQLKSYLAHLSRATPSKSTNKSAKLAFWINAYNALTLEGILQKYPTTSIRKHTSRFGGYNIWKDLPLLVEGKSYSLDDIEHRVLRKMGEPRIHFAIVCASIGCPRLLNRAYTAKQLENQLAENSRDFFSRPQNLQVDPASGTIYVSSILDWFGSDFGKTQQDQFTYLKPYLPKAVRALAVHPQTKIRFLSYDWNLNDQAKKD